MIKNDFFGVTLNISFPIKIHPGRIIWEDKKLANDLDYHGVEFPVQEKDLRNIEKNNKIFMKYFVMKIG